MKRLLTAVIIFSVCLGFSSVSMAGLITDTQQWYIPLADGESFNCIAFYALGLTEFTQAPTWESDPEYTGDTTDWTLELAADSKSVYIHGPRATNTSDDPKEWFTFMLYFQWDTEDTYEPDPAPPSDYDVYMDVAVFDGPIGSAWTYLDAFAGTPGNEASWNRFEGAPFEGPYTNPVDPVPEPTTIGLLGLGLLFFRRRRQDLSI